MTTTATHHAYGTTTARALLMAFELRENPWKLGCTTGPGQQPRERAVAARDQGRLLPEIAQAKRRFGLPESAPVVRGDAAGREGFWRHRFVPAPGIIHQVVDASSIAVKRRQRRATSDAWDVRQWLSRLRRSAYGARQVWRVVPVPSVAAEDQRHRHRALETLKPERASTTTRLKGWRRSQGRRLTSLSKLAEPLEAVRRWDGSEMPRGLRRRWLRV